MILGNTHGGDPLLLVHIHVNGLLGLLGRDELCFCLLEPALVLQEHRMLEMHLRKLRLHASTGEREGLLESVRLRGVVNGLLNEAELLQQLGASLTAKVDGPCVRHLLGGVCATVGLGDANRIIPHVVGATHVHCGLPVLCLDVMSLRLAEVHLGLELLCKVEVGLLQQSLPVLRHQSDHVVVVPVLLVHVDSQVWFVHHKIQVLGLLEPPGALHALGLLYIQSRDLVLAHVRHSQRVRLRPLARLDVHVHGFLRVLGLDVVLLSHLVVLQLLEVLRNFLVEFLGDFWVLGVDNLDSLGPLPGADCALDSLNVLA
mmetsp:Transcript_1150/g.2503  ORF Transcript_1150/g.2503 Transcript_1150/m.2503 type:complete len:315 (+) Transcript_1150:1790-2734(+)